MRQIREMSIIEIDITNACHKHCSNCTRFCGHHKKPFYMDFDTFKRAVNSLDDYQGLISTIGGEPLLHPEYHRFAEYLQQKRGREKLANDGRCQAMVRDCLAFAKVQRWFEGAVNKGKGFLLFTSMPKNYYRNYEAVQDTVTDLWLNDHSNPSFHQPILVSRKDLGIDDATFAQLRDNCWLQNFWSASITPKGAFFCEIAGTLDILFDGPGGKPIEPGWWNKDLSEYADQFHWCDICGMALKTYSRNANDGVDDASPTLYKKLKRIQTPKFRQNGVHLFDPSAKSWNAATSIGMDMASVTANYQPDNSQRVGDAAANLKPRNIYVLHILDEAKSCQEIISTLNVSSSCTSGICIVAPTSREEELKAAAADYPQTRFVFSDFLDRSHLGDLVRRALDVCDEQDWLLVGDMPPAGFAARICEYFLNPGYLFDCSLASSHFLLFSKMASSLQRMGSDRLSVCHTLEDFRIAWGKKVLCLNDGFELLPDFDIPFLREEAYTSYRDDRMFVQRLKQRLQGMITPGSAIFVPHSAFVFHSLSIIKLVQELGYNVFSMANRKFAAYFEDWIDSNHMAFFDESHFSFDKQHDIRQKLREEANFSGALVPFSFGPAGVKPIDDYTDALRTAEDVAGKLLGIVNIRREFIEPEYDIWAEG